MVQNTAILAKIQVQYETGQGELQLGLDILPKVQLRLFLHTRNSKLGKKAEVKTWCICGKFTSKRELVMYNFVNKVVE